jgi:GTP-binding protein HflX
MSRQAILATRTEQEQPDTSEIDALAAAAGYDVAATLTQQRAEDPAYYFGRGKAEAIAEAVREHDGDVLIVDGALSPTQACNLRELCGAAVEVLDRRRLILQVFADQATTRTAQLQIELAELTYRLPRIQTALREGEGNDAQRAPASAVVDGEHGRIRSIKQRIDQLEQKLEQRTAATARHRDQRREQGFDLIAIVGYTNAGKSTLLHRLADDLDVDTESSHADLDAVAAVEDRLFKTLETTTRRATVDGRPVLATDTVGFVDALPHDVIESFGTTLGAARDADVVLLVVDVTNPPEAIENTLRISLDAIGDCDGTVLPVANKLDQLHESVLAGRLETIKSVRRDLERADDQIADSLVEPVAVSALDGTGESRLEERISQELSHDRITLTLPNDGESQAVLSWGYENGAVSDLDYRGEQVRFTFAGRPDVVEQLKRKKAVEPVR